MKCRKARPLLAAYHDGELSPADRAPVEEHLRACAGCAALLADLARADAAAAIPDPGPEYWDRLTDRVMDRLGKDEQAAKTAPRPKREWLPPALRYVVPALAAAALVAVVLRVSGMKPFVPTAPAPPQEVTKAVPETVPGTKTPVAGKGEPDAGASGKEGTGRRRAAGAPAPAAEPTPAPPAARGPAEAGRSLPSTGAALPAVPPPASPKEAARSAEGSARRRSPMEGSPLSDVSSRAPAAAAVSRPAAPPSREEEYRAASPPAGIAAKKDFDLQAEASRAKAAREEKRSAGADSAIPPCERARALAAEGRYKDAETAQRECLAKDQRPASQESGLIFLAELLDRQDRFAEADSVLSEVGRQFVKSRQLDSYLQQREQIQRRQIPPVLPGRK